MTGIAKYDESEPGYGLAFLCGRLDKIDEVW
jgi:hypothetical protein